MALHAAKQQGTMISRNSTRIDTYKQEYDRSKGQRNLEIRVRVKIFLLSAVLNAVPTVTKWHPSPANRRFGSNKRYCRVHREDVNLQTTT